MRSHELEMVNVNNFRHSKNSAFRSSINSNSILNMSERMSNYEPPDLMKLSLSSFKSISSVSELYSVPVQTRVQNVRSF